MRYEFNATIPQQAPTGEIIYAIDGPGQWCEEGGCGSIGVVIGCNKDLGHVVLWEDGSVNNYKLIELSTKPGIGIKYKAQTN